MPFEVDTYGNVIAKPIGVKITVPQPTGDDSAGIVGC